MQIYAESLNFCPIDCQSFEPNIDSEAKLIHQFEPPTRTSVIILKDDNALGSEDQHKFMQNMFGLKWPASNAIAYICATGTLNFHISPTDTVLVLLLQFGY